jgi:hypothetical protein
MSVKRSRPETRNSGAADERDAILRKVRRMKLYAPDKEMLTELEAWIMARASRAGLEPGGLGRNRKRPKKGNKKPPIGQGDKGPGLPE